MVHIFKEEEEEEAAVTFLLTKLASWPMLFWNKNPPPHHFSASSHMFSLLGDGGQYPSLRLGTSSSGISEGFPKRFSISATIYGSVLYCWRGEKKKEKKEMGCCLLALLSAESKVGVILFHGGWLQLLHHSHQTGIKWNCQTLNHHNKEQQPRS